MDRTPVSDGVGSLAIVESNEVQHARRQIHRTAFATKSRSRSGHLKALAARLKRIQDRRRRDGRLYRGTPLDLEWYAIIGRASGMADLDAAPLDVECILQRAARLLAG